MSKVNHISFVPVDVVNEDSVDGVVYTQYDKKWISLKNAPSDVVYGSTAMINDNEFVFIRADMSRSNRPPLYKYNIAKNEWLKLQTYPIDFNLSAIDFTVFNHFNNKLYIFSGKLIIIDTKSWKMEYFHTNLQFQCAVIVNGIIHAFCASIIMSATHYIWNDDESEFEEINSIQDRNNIDINQAIYVSSINKILLFIESISEEYELWEYEIDSATYRKIEGVNIPTSDASIMLTMDEKYIIIAGGYNIENDDTDNIFVIEICKDSQYRDIMKLRQCIIQCPMKGSHHMLRVNGKATDELLVMGYIRNLYKSDVSFEAVDIMPDDVIKFAAKWYKTEMIHWIQFEYTHPAENKKAHFAISVDDIISSALTRKSSTS